MIGYDTAYCMLLSKRSEEAESLCIRLLNQFPSNLDLQYLLGAVFLEKKDYMKAIDSYHTFLAAREKMEQAQTHTRLIIDTYSFHHKAWGNISDCHYASGEYDKALKAAERAIVLRTDLPVYAITKARILIKMNRLDEAKQVLDSHEDTNNTNPDFYIRYSALARISKAIGSYDEILLRGIEHHPESEEIRNVLAYAKLNENAETSEKQWNTILASNPDHFGARIGLVKLYARQSSLREFNRHTDYLIENTDSPGLIKEAGYLCLTMNSFPKAVNCLEKYLKHYPDDSKVLTDLATCYAKMGSYEAALLGYSEVLKKIPNDPTTLKNIAVIKKIFQNA